MNSQEIFEKINKIEKTFNYSNLKSSAEKISLSYRNDSGNGRVIAKTKNEAIAYALSRMPATMAANEFVLKDFIELTGFKPKTVIDLGSGTGASSVILKGLFNEKFSYFNRSNCSW